MYSNPYAAAKIPIFFGALTHNPRFRQRKCIDLSFVDNKGERFLDCGEYYIFVKDNKEVLDVE